MMLREISGAKTFVQGRDSDKFMKYWIVVPSRMTNFKAAEKLGLFHYLTFDSQ